MGKRGPSPRGEYHGKSQVFSTRIRPDLRAMLGEAAKRSGRSLSQEVEHRLRRSFVEDERMADAFGSRRNYLIFRLAATAMQASDKADLGDWLDEPALFDHAIQVMNGVIEAIRPSGPRWHRKKTPNEEFLYATWGAAVWEVIKKADPSLALNEGTREQHQEGIAKADLGEIVRRAAGFDALPEPAPPKSKPARRGKKS